MRAVHGTACRSGLEPPGQGSFRAAPKMLGLGMHSHAGLQRQPPKSQLQPCPGWCLGAIKAGLGRVASMSWSLQAREASGLLAKG